MRGKKTGGRKLGTPNKVTADVRALAQQHATEVLAALLSIASDRDQPGSARVAACKEILDRGYGKSQERTHMDFIANVPMYGVTDVSTPTLNVVFIDSDEAENDR